MKYSKENQPLVCMQTQSTCYKETSVMKVKGILMHSTGANNPNLKRYIQPSDKAINKDEMIELLGKNLNNNDYNHTDLPSGLNAWIGKLADGTVTTIQTMPWNYRPWGCAAGEKGSCNNGWIQFEICEDNLNNKTYFEKIYQEACELIAYLCQMYSLNPYGTVMVNDIQIPIILCHADAHELGFGSNHADVLHWFNKYGKTMNDVRNDVAKLLNIEPEKQPEILYYVKENWEENNTIKNSYRDLELATIECDKLGNNYKVYNDEGISIYPIELTESIETEEEIPTIQESKFKIRQEVKVLPGSKYTTGESIPTWVTRAKLYVRGFNTDGTVVFSTKKYGPITGATLESNLIDPTQDIKILEEKVNEPEEEKEVFKPYIVKIDTDVLNVRMGPGTNHKITAQVTKNFMFTIIEEKNGWGKLKSGAGWILLKYTTKP